MIRIAIAIAAIAVAALGWWWSRLPLPLPERLALETLVVDLGATGPEEPGVRLGALTPGDAFAHDGVAREALVTPPGTRLRRRLQVPPNAILRFGMAVEGEGRRDPARAGVRFSVAIDDTRVFTHVLNPAATRKDRFWVDGEVPLTDATARELTLTFATELDGGGAAAGTPGWSDVRVITHRFRDRQRRDAAHPNVILLLVDTLRADRLGLHGATPTPSPTLDHLAASGAQFAAHIAEAPWTLPSVASILTAPTHPPTAPWATSRVASATTSRPSPSSRPPPASRPSACRPTRSCRAGPISRAASRRSTSSTSPRYRRHPATPRRARIPRLLPK